MHVWTADVELSERQAAGLIRRQFPTLGDIEMAPLGAGWDNQAWLVNEAWVFRFPRRRIAASLIATELRYLPELARHLPAPIPVPIFAGQPDDTYPYPFAGYRMLPGITACSAGLTDEDRARLARPLASFLRSLHGVPITAEITRSGPRDEIGRSDLPLRLRSLEPRMERVAHHHPDLDMPALRACAAELARTPAWPGPVCWVHGDLYVRHLVIGEADAGQERALRGVIDWGDLHLGEPSLDLSIVFSFLPPRARPAFWARYGDVHPHLVARARFRALSYGIILLDYGREIGDLTLVRAGRTALAFAADQHVAV
jgi:aminoglycoside phosphotransferase (APT) family kinase protein